MKEKTSKRGGDRSLEDQAAVGYFQWQAAKLRYKYRPITSYDQGIDGEVQLDESLSSCIILGTQVKGRSSRYVNKDNTISISVKESNLSYWEKFGRPVIMVVCLDPLSTLSPRFCWARCDNQTEKTIKVDLSQLFDENTKQIVKQSIRILSLLEDGERLEVRDRLDERINGALVREGNEFRKIESK